MEGPKLCLILLVTLFGLGESVHSKRSSFLSHRVNYNRLNEDNYNNVLSDNKDSRDAFKNDKNERIFDRFKDEVIVNKFKAYLYKLIDHYENDEEKFYENRIDREENENINLHNLDKNDYENNIGNHLHHHDKTDVNRQKNIWKNEIEEEKVNLDDREYKDLEENADNKDEIDEDNNIDDKDDIYLDEREDSEDNMENHNDKEFGMMDYLIDTNWADEGKGNEGGLRDIQRGNKMDGDYIPNDYFDNSDYEA